MRVPRRPAVPARGVAAAPAALLAFAAGRTTPVVQPSVDVPGRFMASPASDEEPEAA
jgi:hypothetical protein